MFLLPFRQYAINTYFPIRTWIGGSKNCNKCVLKKRCPFSITIFNESESTQILVLGSNICDIICRYENLEIDTNRNRRNHFFIGVVITSCT